MDKKNQRSQKKTFGRRSLFARVAGAVAAGAGLGHLLPRAIRSIVTSENRPLNVSIHPSAVSRTDKESPTHGS